MYIHSLNQSWLDVPFWRRKFLVADMRMLLAVMESGATMITIDDSRGVGPLLDLHPAAPEVADVVPVAPIRIERRRRPRPPDQVTEFDRARDTVARSKAAIIDMFAEARMGNAVEVEGIAPLVDEIAASVARDQTAIISVTRLKNKNEYTYLHSVAVCALMMNLARQIGLSDEEVRLAGLAGMLHDIGKMAIPAELLDKPAALDDDEWRVVQTHPEQGHALLCRSRDVADAIRDVCLHHHERMDGSGYPEGLTGDRLSTFARMSAICDVYDAVTSVRPYKRPWSPSEALARMLTWKGHFDPRLLRAFMTSLGIFPIGSVVRLHSNRLAMVVQEDPADPTMPVVRLFYDVEGQCAVPIEDVATHSDGERILQGESGEHWFGDRWPGMARDITDANPGKRDDASGEMSAPARRAAA